jgi:uncharacterized protein (TIGR03435 family)
MKESAPDAALAAEDPWVPPTYTVGKDAFPVFPAGHGGVAGTNGGNYRWTGVKVSMPEIVKTFSYYLGRQVVDATGLKGKYDINITWSIDLAWVFESNGLPPAPEVDHGPTLLRAVQDQLGLKLVSKKGSGDIVVVDHVEKTPVEN